MSNTGSVCALACTLKNGLAHYEPIKTEKNLGLKHDDGKNRWDLVPFKYLDELVKVYTFGSKKYADNSWQKVDKERYFAALMRHITAWRDGEKKDKDSGLRHLAHAMWNCVALMYKDDEKVSETVSDDYSDAMSYAIQSLYSSGRRSGKSNMTWTGTPLHNNTYFRCSMVPIDWEGTNIPKEGEVRRLVNGSWITMKTPIKPKFLLGCSIIGRTYGAISKIIGIDREREQYTISLEGVTYFDSFSNLHEKCVKVRCSNCKHRDKEEDKKPCNKCDSSSGSNKFKLTK